MKLTSLLQLVDKLLNKMPRKFRSEDCLNLYTDSDLCCMLDKLDLYTVSEKNNRYAFE